MSLRFTRTTQTEFRRRACVLCSKNRLVGLSRVSAVELLLHISPTTPGAGRQERVQDEQRVLREQQEDDDVRDHGGGTEMQEL